MLQSTAEKEKALEKLNKRKDREEESKRKIKKQQQQLLFVLQRGLREESVTNGEIQQKPRCTLAGSHYVYVRKYFKMHADEKKSRKH